VLSRIHLPASWAMTSVRGFSKMELLNCKTLQQAFRFAEIRITADPPRALPLHGPCGMIAATAIEAASNAA
jgi:hypothetical protein